MQHPNIEATISLGLAHREGGIIRGEPWGMALRIREKKTLDFEVYSLGDARGSPKGTT